MPICQVYEIVSYRTSTHTPYLGLYNYLRYPLLTNTHEKLDNTSEKKLFNGRIWFNHNDWPIKGESILVLTLFKVTLYVYQMYTASSQAGSAL
jgi:hypothetical protein